MDPKTVAGGAAGGRNAFQQLMDTFLQYQTIRMQTNAQAAAAAGAAQDAALGTVSGNPNPAARPLTAAELLGLRGDQYSVPWYLPVGLIAAGALTAYLIFGR